MAEDVTSFGKERKKERRKNISEMKKKKETLLEFKRFDSPAWLESLNIILILYRARGKFAGGKFAIILRRLEL